MDFIKSFFTVENITNIATNLAIVVFTIAMGWGTFTKKFNELKEKEDKKGNTASIKGEIKRQSNVDMKITKKLEELKEVLNADRVQIYDFHNGIHYANGRSAIRMTCTYETCRYGIKSCQNQLIGIPISCLPNFVSTLLDKGEFECKDIETIKESNPATYSFKKNMQISSFYDTLIYNEDKDPVGFIAIQFCENKYKVDKSEIQKVVGYVEAELFALIKQEVERNNADNKKKK